MYTSKTTHVIASGSIRNSTDYQLRRAAAENITIVPPAFVAKKLQDYKESNPSFGQPAKVTTNVTPSHATTTTTVLAHSEEEYDEEEWREQLLDLTTTTALNPTVTEVIPATGPVTGNTRVRQTNQNTGSCF